MQLTIKKLKELINDLPDDTMVVSRSDNYEMGNAIVPKSDYGIHVKKYKKEKKTFRDDFDGTVYQSAVFVEDESGEVMLLI